VIRAALKGVAANKLRLALTGFAIVISVAFVAASFVFTDTINARFEVLLTDVSAGVDVYVRPIPPETGNDLLEGGSIPEETLSDVLAVPGVRIAEGAVGGIAQFIDSDGNPVGGQGPPTFGFSWGEVEELNPLRIAEGNGRPPTAPGEVVADVGTARSAGFSVGDTVTVIAVGGPEQYELVGLATFGEEDNLAGATTAVFELSEAQRVLDLEGRLSEISVASESGVDADALAADIDQALGDGFKVQTAEASNQEQLADIASDLGFLTTALLAFAGVAVFVSAFIIYNTFRIIVAQRTRELALLRAIGATGSQVTWLVVFEAFIVAVLASVVGVLLGMGLAQLLAAAMSALGISLPEGPLTLAPRTVLIAVGVGVVMTLISAVLPARKAASVPPVAAMHTELARVPRKSLRNRAVTGVVVTLVGLTALLIGLFSSVENPLAIVGLGALVFFLGVSILAPLAAKPVAYTIGWPLPRLFNTTGQLAQENTARQPRRTASTASALMIGVALVVFVAILAASIKSTIQDQVTDNFLADLTATSTNPELGMSPVFAEEMAALDEFDTVAPLIFGSALLFDTENADAEPVGIELLAVDPELAPEVLNLDPAPGAYEALAGSDGILVFDELMSDEGWVVGDTIVMGFPQLAETDVEIVGTFAKADFGQYVIDRSFYNTVYDNPFDDIVFATVVQGVAIDDARAAADLVAEPYANVQVQNKDELVADIEAQIDQLLGLIIGLLFLAIIIAVLGITNTLALSIIERTREIGLLRAVGMTRFQTSWMVRWEAVIVAIFGAIMGVGIGVFLGWAVVQALGDEGLGSFAIPWGQIAILVLVAGFAGIIAAIYPSWKASRIDVLDAIAYE